ncbi:MAG: hypothetical protein WCP98_19210 [Actinomycetes bacterium]
MDETQKRSFRQQVIALLKLSADGERSAAGSLLNDSRRRQAS